MTVMELVQVAMKPPGRLNKEWDKQWSPAEWVEYRTRPRAPGAERAPDEEEPVEVKLARFLLSHYIDHINDDAVMKRRRTE